MTFFDATVERESIELSSFDHVVVIVAAQMTRTLELALAIENVLVMSPATIKAEHLIDSNIGALQEVLRGHAPLIFTSPLNARAELRGRLRRPKAPILSFVEAPPATTARDHARELYQRGQIGDALYLYDSIVNDGEIAEPEHEAALLGAILCLIAMGREADARIRASSLRVPALTSTARLTAARAFAALSMDRSVDVSDEEADELRAFNELRIGNVPATIPTTPDLALQAAMLLIQEKRFETAATWALTVSEKASSHAPLGVFFAEVVALLVEGWSWDAPSDSPLRHETAIELLSAFATIEALPEHPLDKSLRVRLLRASLQVAMRTADLTKADELARNLDGLGVPPPGGEAFTSAIEAAKRGDLDEATRMLGVAEPEWRGRFQRATMLFLANQPAAGLATLLELTVQVPGVPVVETEAARRLIAQRKYDEALPHAESAFLLLPGIGQRLMFAECLLVFDQDERAADLLRAYADRDARARVLFAQAIEKTNLSEALIQWARHLEAHSEDWHSHIHVIILHAHSGALKIAADLAWTLVQARNTDLPSPILFQAALLQNAAPVEAEERVRRIAQIHAILEKRGRREDDTLRVLLWQHLRNREALPASNLRGFLEPVVAPGSEDDRAQVELQRELRKHLNLLYSWGHVSLQAASHFLADDQAQLVLRLGDDISLTSGEPSDAAQTETTLSAYKELHLGLLELFALGRLSLLQSLSERLGPSLKLRVFDDVPVDLLQIVLELSQEQPNEQLLQATRLVAAAESGHVTITDEKSDIRWVSVTTQDEESDLASFLAWLRDSGGLSVNTYGRASAGLPGPQPRSTFSEPIGLRASALRWLVERDLLAIVSRALGDKLRLLKSDLAELRSTIHRAGQRAAALTLATQTHTWLGAQQLAGTAAIIPRRSVTLPAVRPNTIDAQLSSIVFALSSKEEVVDNPDRALVALDAFVRDLFSSPVFLPRSLNAFQWTGDLFRATRQRYASTTKQVHGLAWLVNQLVPERNNELTEELLLWGDSSAFSPHSLLQLARDYPSFAGRAARILSSQEVALFESRHAQHPAIHFALAKVEAGFLKLSLSSVDGSTVNGWWRALLARWHKVNAPQKVWLLGFVMSALVDSAPSAFVPLHGTDRFQMSSDSTVDAAAGALAAWSEDDSSDVLGHVVTEILLTIDRERKGAPDIVILTPIVMLLTKAAPPRDLISLSHSWMEPFVILSRTWPSDPLAEMFERLELPDGATLQITFSDLLAHAVALTEEKPAEVLFGLTGARFKWPLSQTHHMVAEVPLEAILLSAKPEVIKALGVAVASKVGPFDGALYELMIRLVTDPTDNIHRRAFALRAVSSPMRLVRRMPGMLAYWGLPFALPKAINITKIDELKTLLSEPLQSSQESATSRLAGYVSTIWKERHDLATIVGQSARFPGGMGWQWAVRALELEDDEELSRAKRLLGRPASAHFGELWWCIATEWIRAANADDLQARQQFAGAVDELLKHLIHSSQRGKMEARALSCVRGVVARLGATGNDALWLTYRLFGWWFAIAVNHQSGIDVALEDLARGRQPNQLMVNDAAEPLQWTDDFDIRLSSVLNVLAVGPDLVTHWTRENGKPAWSTPLSSESIDTFIACASIDIGDEPDSSDAMDWVPPIRTSTAALAALFRNGGKFGMLPVSVRREWLSWIPMTEEEEQRRPRTAVLQLIHFATMELAELSLLEGALLADRCLNSTAPNLQKSPITAVAIALTAGRKFIPLDDAFARIMPHLEDTDIGRAFVAIYLDSVLAVEPTRARQDALRVLTRIGRDVSDASLIEAVKTEPSFSSRESARSRLLAALGNAEESEPPNI